MADSFKSWLRLVVFQAFLGEELTAVPLILIAGMKVFCVTELFTPTSRHFTFLASASQICLSLYCLAFSLISSEHFGPSSETVCCFPVLLQ